MCPCIASMRRSSARLAAKHTRTPSAGPRRAGVSTQESEHAALCSTHKCSTNAAPQKRPKRERACWHGIGLRARRHSGAQAAHRIRPVVKLCASDHVWQYIGGNVHQHACCALLPCREARLPRWQLQRSLQRESHLYPRAVSRCACSASSPRYEAGMMAQWL